ncbi:hypothetical protein AB0B45_40005 [Nonomuraea sp. NPDC049152]|uniref:hypothetical protein n=1 Tax=Nonomuraea sp. NPDC049152 TaxID=3154350 RepID=UPI00340B6201
MKIAYRAIAAAACLSLLAACSGEGGDDRERVGTTADASRTAVEGRVGMAATPTASPTPAGPPPLSPRWKNLGKVPLDEASGLVDVVATGPRQAWALGYENGAEEEIAHTTVVRWNGTKWSRMPINKYLGHNGFDATGPEDLWVAGDDTVAHWDGRRWTAKRPFGISDDKHFRDVASDGDKAVLIGSDDTGSFIATSGRGGFELVPNGDEGMLEAVTFRSGHAWIVGAKPRSNCEGITPHIVHSRKLAGWDTMRVPHVPGGMLTSVVQISPTDVWAVGKIIKTRPAEQLPDSSCPESVYYEAEEVESPVTPLAMHWDGRSWQQVGLPSMSAELTSVTAFGPDDVWVAGKMPEHPVDLVFLHFDGKAWTEEHSYGGRVEAIAAIPGTKDVWAVGRPDEHTDKGPELILRRDGRGRPGRARS